MNIFNKFAFILTTTCMIALIFSLVYFTALSHGFGPEGKTGNLERAVKQCLSMFKCNNDKKRVHHKHKAMVIDVQLPVQGRKKERRISVDMYS